MRFRAKKYKIQEKSFSLADFRQMMTHLPEPVADQEILEMFNFADKDRDGRINFDEFLVMITPVKAPEPQTVHNKQQKPLNNNIKNNEKVNINHRELDNLGQKDEEKSGLLNEETTKNDDLILSNNANADCDDINTNKTHISDENNIKEITNNIPKIETSITTTIIPSTTTITTSTTTISNNIPVATLITTA